MSQEIERKFFITQPIDQIISQDPLYKCHHIAQAYVDDADKWTLRIRQITDITPNMPRNLSPTVYRLTMKKKITLVTCHEIEIPIPVAKFNQLQNLAGSFLLKNRYTVNFAGCRWEIDHFLNPELKGLIIAEIELLREDQLFTKPPWLGEEITYDRQYKNAKLVKQLTSERMSL